ncbi:hypothetical protein HYX16_04990 [Candidatus Woesearchaeota archaeon]|nr:hypothetical protein [Candidatus Woesearchaeota archaeon]
MGKNLEQKLWKEAILMISILFLFYLISRIFEDLTFILWLIIFSFGIMAIIWTLLAKYSLSPKSNLRLFTNNFLACSIAVLAFSVTRFINDFLRLRWLLFVELFFIFITFFFFVLASYYTYKIGSEFGFQRESWDIKRILKEKKK